MNTEVRKRLHDAIEACRAVAIFLAGKDFAAYERDLMLRSAVERQFEIIGEALGRAVESYPALSDAIPELPRIVGFRNRIIHGYDSVDDELVWDIVTNKVGALERNIAALLADK